MDDIVKCWDDKAADWKKYVGDRGDTNRRFNSDPVLWRFAGDVSGLRVLDAGCGTGYLSFQLARRGALVTGIDLSEKMIAESKSAAAQQITPVDFRVDSCLDLETVISGSFDLVVSNYVLMDLPKLDLAIQSFYRALAPGGRVVCIFSHPFNSGLNENENYFDEIKKVERWGPFNSDFIFFHRPLSTYWQSFRRAGFSVLDFDEPVAANPEAPDFKEEWKSTYRRKPWSVAFHLLKT